MASEEADDAYEWQPPSEAEMKVIEARRERTNKISNIMGQYLLKGYTMLGSTCPECQTILLKTKQGELYCIACSELESDVGKDDPALNSRAAQRQAEEQQTRSTSTGHSNHHAAVGSVSTQAASCAKPVIQEPAVSSARCNFSSSTSAIPERSVNPPTLDRGVYTQPWHHEGCTADLDCPISVIERKLKWATEELDRNENVEESSTLCNLIKNCADTLVALHAAKSVYKKNQ